MAISNGTMAVKLCSKNPPFFNWSGTKITSAMSWFRLKLHCILPATDGSVIPWQQQASSMRSNYMKT